MTARTLSRMLVVAGALATLGLALAGVLASRLIALRGEIAAAAQSTWRTQLVDRDGQTPGSVSTFNAIRVELAP